MNTLHVDVELARYSDWAFTSAVVALVVALLLLAVELAYTRTRTAGQLVTAGAVTAPPPALSTRRRVAPSTNASGGAVWRSPTSASRCCWPASCCAGWRRCGRPGATCTSS